jgi:hypothetical protein
MSTGATGATGPAVYASTIFQNVTLNNSDLLSFNANQAVPRSYVDQKVANLIDGATGTLDTLNEIAKALKDDAKIVDTLLSQVDSKVAAEAKSRSDEDLLIRSQLKTAYENADLVVEGKVTAEEKRAKDEEKILSDRIDTKVNLDGTNILTGALKVQGGLNVSLNGSSFLYVGDNWRINAGNNGKTLLFEYNPDPSGGGLWGTAVPFIQM